MHPEHFDLASPMFLPITDEMCEKLLATNGATALTSLSDPELATVLVIQNLVQANEKDITSDSIEKILARIIAWSVDHKNSTNPSLLSEAQRLFDQRKLYFGLKIVKQLKLTFLMADEITEQEYLLPSGKWDTSYKARRRLNKNPFSEIMITHTREHWLTGVQDKLVRTFRANLDEHLHVQGYAGIGKSHLVGTLIDCLRPGTALILAQTQGKLTALQKRIGLKSNKSPGLVTFERLARMLLKSDSNNPGIKSAKPYQNFNAKTLALDLNILGFRNHDAKATLNICLKIVERYCRSRDYTLSTKHIPHFKQALSSLDNQVLLEYSSRLWTLLDRHPIWGSQTGIEEFLLIKRASLAGCMIPARYTHVFIDESQGIPKSLLQIIERGNQVLITLGDEYQDTQDTEAKRKSGLRENGVRHHHLSYSVRSGRNVERLVNPLISIHSNKSKIPFEGARDGGVSIEHYPREFAPPESCVILTASYWDTMKWAIQMKDASCSFRLADSDALKDFQQFMSTAIALFKPEFYISGPGNSGTHREFSEMRDWEQVRESNKFDESFRWIETVLDKGFNAADVTRLCLSPSNSTRSCLIMQAQNAGGMEFDRVLLTPGLLTTEKFKDVNAFDQRVCEVYIAISRAKNQLYLPYDVVEWAEFHYQQKYQESVGY
ncbi:hypothetical protein [Pseudomonas viridiflava]|uniref:hypothetical protein n=1 Tax=Pseudomonas viridiflava TaxID=33069 RepID=UPI000F0381C0|nr:hypothetical protein [Pseudomonas viridiflava]